MTSPDAVTPHPKLGRLLVVDDETRLMTALCKTLAEQGYETAGFTTAAEALNALKQQEFDVLITDMQMSEMDGMALLREAQAVDPQLAAIMMTGHGTIETAVQAIKLGAFDYVQKPLRLRDLMPVLTRALEMRRLRKENLQLRETLGIFELCVAIGFTLDTGTILNKVMDAALQQIGADETSVLLLTSDSKNLYVAAARGARREQILNQQIALGDNIAGWVVRHREPLILNGPVNDPRFVPLHPRGDIYAAISLPMMVGGECVGVLNVNATRPGRPFTLGQVKTLTILTATAAAALQAAALHTQLMQSEQHLRDITDNLPHVLWMASSDASRLLYVNSAYEKLWGRTRQSVLDNFKSWLDPIHPDDLPEVRAHLERVFQGKPTNAKYRIVMPDRSIRFIADCAFPIVDKSGTIHRVVGFAEDVTERTNLQQQLQQAQKMEAFGQLAGGVSHDFNNLLTVITSFSEMILSGIIPAEKQRDSIREIRKAGERAASLTRQLLAFSRKQLLQPVELDLNRVVAETEKMLRRLIGEDIDLATSLDPALGLVKADPGQIEQVIMNLVVNARDAMPTGGHLTIETRIVELDQDDTQKRAELQPGDYVMLAVTDTGCGMDEATQAKIFEPFFTTKEVGKGTGLGLATVHGIVKQSGGGIAVYSEVGHGTTFKIYLPRLKAAVSSGKSLVEVSLLPRGTETILLAENEEAVQATLRLVLESNGYTVLAAQNGEETVKICRQHPGAIHLLMTDVVMPKMSGRLSADLVVGLRPQMKVLYMSGYTDDAIVRHGVMEAGMAFLQKPFTPMVLTRKVREVLDAGNVPTK